MLRPGWRRFDARCQACRRRHRRLSFLLSIFSVPESCCIGMSGLFVAVFPRSNKLALVLHGELQLHMHGLGLSGGCFFFVCLFVAVGLPHLWFNQFWGVSLTDPLTPA